MKDPKAPLLDDEAATWAAYARHVAPGKVAAYEALGFKVTMGRRRGARFDDAFSDRSWIDCHTNGGVFALGHRNPRVVAAVRALLLALRRADRWWQLRVRRRPYPFLLPGKIER